MAPQAKSLPAKYPSVASDLLMLGDIYLSLGWLAVQRLRYGPLWPWDRAPRRRQAHRPAEPAPLRRA